MMLLVQCLILQMLGQSESESEQLMSRIGVAIGRSDFVRALTLIDSGLAINPDDAILRSYRWVKDRQNTASWPRLARLEQEAVRECLRLRQGLHTHQPG